MSELLERIAAATADVGVLSKDKSNRHDGYDYLSEEAVKRAVQSAIAKHLIAPDSITYEVLSDEWLDGRKAAMNYVKLRCVLHWGTTRVEGLGCGRDYGDKALMKAQTSALREAWKTRLTIPTGNDPEKADDSTDERHDDAPAQRGKGGGGVRLPNMAWLGEHANKPIKDVPSEMLVRYGEWKKGKLDPDSQYHARDVAQLDAIRDLLKARKASEATE